MAHLGFDQNEYGTRISLHKCDVCGVEFQACPAHEANIPCGVKPCASYDQAHDFDRHFDENGRLRDDANATIVEIPKSSVKA